jgi:hypothetical protein
VAVQWAHKQHNQKCEDERYWAGSQKQVVMGNIDGWLWALIELMLLHAK